MTTPILGQMDVGPMMPGVCALTGFVIIPAALAAYFLVARRKTRSALTIAFTVIASLMLVAWTAALIDLHYEPSIDDTGAVSVVENLPEVRAFEAKPVGDSLLTRDARVTSDPPNSPGWQVTVGDFDQAGQLKLVWNVFAVNAVSGEIQVLGPDQKWKSLQAWRATPLR